MNRKTILIALNNGIAARNILQTDIFRTLQRGGAKVVLLTPNAEEKSFRERYNFENVYFEKLELDKYKAYLHRFKVQYILKCVRWFTLNGRYDISTISDWYEKVRKVQRRRERLRDKVINFIEDSLIYILRKSSVLRNLFIRVECIFFAPSYHRDIFLKHKPQWALVTSLGFFDFDQYIMREAKRHGAKIISFILSWDNTSSRGIGAAPTDKVVAWTDIMKRELVTLHDMKPEKIFVGGVAHFDHYYRKESIYGRQEFLSKFGLSDDRKIIFLATKSPTGFPWNPDMVEIIAEAIHKNKFRHPCQLLVRIHPIHFRRREGTLRFKHFFDRYDEISRKYGHVSFNTPHIQSGEMDFDMPETEMYDVASFFHYSDIVINMFSTMNIEASIFDTPIINICFEGDTYQENKRPRDDIRIDEMQTHNQRIIKTGGIRVAYNRDELINLINLYLENPGIDREGRSRIVEQECGPNRGNAGRVIGEHLLKLFGCESKNNVIFDNRLFPEKEKSFSHPFSE